MQQHRQQRHRIRPQTATEGRSDTPRNLLKRKCWIISITYAIWFGIAIFLWVAHGANLREWGIERSKKAMGPLKSKSPRSIDDEGAHPRSSPVTV
jgi:hypothetical protein